MFRTDDFPEDTDTWDVIWEDASWRVQGQDLDLRRLDLHRGRRASTSRRRSRISAIDNPYVLNDEQFNAAVDLLENQAADVGEYWPGAAAKQIKSFTNGDTVVGTTWPYQYVQLDRRQPWPSRGSSRRKARPGWSDTG